MHKIKQPKWPKVVDVKRISQRLHKVDTCGVVEHNLDLLNELLAQFRIDAKPFEAEIALDRDDFLVNPFLKVGTLLEEGLEQLRREDLLINALPEGHVRAWADHQVDALHVSKRSDNLLK